MTEWSNHPTLSALRSKRLSHSKMKWWAICTNLPINVNSVNSRFFTTVVFIAQRIQTVYKKIVCDVCRLLKHKTIWSSWKDFGIFTSLLTHVQCLQQPIWLCMGIQYSLHISDKCLAVEHRQIILKTLY